MLLTLGTKIPAKIKYLEKMSKLFRKNTVHVIDDHKEDLK